MTTHEVIELRNFKTYTHQRMDQLDVPHEVLDNPHTAAGCRIGGRFDYLEEQLAQLKRNLAAKDVLVSLLSERLADFVSDKKPDNSKRAKA